MLSFLCNDKRDGEEPGHLKFLNALEEDTENNFSYLVPMNIANGVCVGGGTIYPGVMCLPLQPSCILSFLCNDQKDWEEPGHLKFLNALQEDVGNNFYLVPMNIVNGGGGKVPPPPHLNPHACFHFYVMINGMRRAWLFVVSECPSRGCWKQFLISRWSLWT